MLGTGSDSKLLREGVGGVTGWLSWREAGAPVWRARFSVTRERGQSRADSGGCHTVVGYRKKKAGAVRRGGGCHEGGDRNGKGGHPGAPGKSPRGGSQKEVRRAKLDAGLGDAGKGSVPAAGSGAGGSAWCSVPEEERTGAGKNPRRKSATPSTSIAMQQAANVPEPIRMVPAHRAGIPAP